MIILKYSQVFSSTLKSPRVFSSVFMALRKQESQSRLHNQVLVVLLVLDVIWLVHHFSTGKYNISLAKKKGLSRRSTARSGILVQYKKSRSLPLSLSSFKKLLYSYLIQQLCPSFPSSNFYHSYYFYNLHLFYSYSLYHDHFRLYMVSLGSNWIISHCCCG